MEKNRICPVSPPIDQPNRYGFLLYPIVVSPGKCCFDKNWYSPKTDWCVWCCSLQCCKDWLMLVSLYFLSPHDTAPSHVTNQVSKLNYPPLQDGPGSHLVTRRILQGWAEGPAPWLPLSPPSLIPRHISTLGSDQCRNGWCEWENPWDQSNRVKLSREFTVFKPNSYGSGSLGAGLEQRMWSWRKKEKFVKRRRHDHTLAVPKDPISDTVFLKPILSQWSFTWKNGEFTSGKGVARRVSFCKSLGSPSGIRNWWNWSSWLIHFGWIGLSGPLVSHKNFRENLSRTLNKWVQMPDPLEGCICLKDDDKDSVEEQIQDIQAGNTNMDALRGPLRKAGCLTDAGSSRRDGWWIYQRRSMYWFLPPQLHSMRPEQIELIWFTGRLDGSMWFDMPQISGLFHRFSLRTLDEFYSAWNGRIQRHQMSPDHNSDIPWLSMSHV